MAHGTPDWGVTAGAKTVFQLTDLAEHAARLGSIDTYERAGDIIAMEDFESGLGSITVGSSGAGGAAGLTTGFARSGLFACRLTGGSTGGRKGTAAKQTPIIELSNFGVEASFRVPDNVQYVQLALLVYDGTNLIQYVVRWDDPNSRLEYLNSGGTYTTLAEGVALATAGKTFHTGKLVIATSASEYLRFRLNGTTYSLADIAGYSAANATLPYLHAEIAVVSRSGQNDAIYADDIILTQNEPS